MSRGPLRHAPASRRSAAAALTLIATICAWVAACTRSAKVDLFVTVPEALDSQVMWIEISVYEDVKCDLAGRIAHGQAPIQGPVQRLIWSPTQDQATPPELGELTPGYYSFVAQVKNTDCEVIAHGCDGLDIGSHSEVRIATQPLANPSSGCMRNTTCELGQCLPNRGGQNCALDLVGSGPLVQGTDGGTRMIVAAPAARFVGSDFLVAYGELREGGGAETTLVPQLIARNGGLKPFAPIGFPDRCASTPQDDGTGFAWSPEGTGLVAFSRNACSNGTLASTGLELRLIGAEGAGKDRRTATLSVGSADLGPVRLGPNHAVAALGAGRWAIAPVHAGRAEALFVDEVSRPGAGEDASGNTFAVGDAEGGAGPLRYAFGLPDTRQIAANLEASSSAVVLVAVNEYDDTPAPPDGGAQGEIDGGGQTVRQQPGGLALRKLSVQFLPVDRIAARAPLPLPYSVNSRFASVALIANRALVVGDGYTPQDPTLYAFDFDPNGNPTTLTEPRTSAILTNDEARGTTVDNADIAVANDRAFVVTAMPGDIVLTVFSQASTQPNVLRSLRLSQLRAATVGTIRDGRVSVAASQNRVLVAWTTATSLKDNDPIGGYAIFACEP